MSKSGPIVVKQGCQVHNFTVELGYICSIVAGYFEVCGLKQPLQNGEEENYKKHDWVLILFRNWTGFDSWTWQPNY